MIHLRSSVPLASDPNSLPECGETLDTRTSELLPVRQEVRQSEFTALPGETRG